MIKGKWQKKTENGRHKTKDRVAWSKEKYKETENGRHKTKDRATRTSLKWEWTQVFREDREFLLH